MIFIGFLEKIFLGADGLNILVGTQILDNPNYFEMEK
jgi:hypothetical protein